MKRWTIAAIVSLTVILAMLMMTGCESSKFGLASNDDGSFTLTAENAEAGSVASAGGVKIGESERLNVEPTFEAGGEIELMLFNGEIEADDLDDADDLNDEDLPAPVADHVITGISSVKIEVPAGEYTIVAKAKSETTGTATIKVEKYEKPKVPQSNGGNISNNAGNNANEGVGDPSVYDSIGQNQVTFPDTP